MDTQKHEGDAVLRKGIEGEGSIPSGLWEVGARIGEVEIPGLMACRFEFGTAQPFKGARITGSLYMTIQNVLLIKTLTALGAKVRWCSYNILSTQDHATAAISRDSCALFTWKGETLQEYWWCTERALDWGPGGGPNLNIHAREGKLFSLGQSIEGESAAMKKSNCCDSDWRLNLVQNGYTLPIPMAAQEKITRKRNNCR